MIDIGIGGKVNVQKIHRLVRDDEVLIGYPDGIMHPIVVGHKTTKTGRKSKKKAYSVLLSNVQNSDLARLLHFGSKRIPARPWLYQSIAENRTELRNMIKRTIQKRIKEGREPEGQFSLEGIGAFLVGCVQRFVRGGYYKSAQPNAPRTIKAKGSDTPLIDTGFLVNSTTFLVKKGPAKVAARTLEAK